MLFGIEVPLAIQIARLPTLVLGSTSSFNVTLIGSFSPIQLTAISLNQQILPSTSSIQITPSSGVAGLRTIQLTPQATGSVSIFFTALDSTGFNTSMNVSLLVVPPSLNNYVTLSDLDGTTGFALMGPIGYGLGTSVASVGDINGDGIDDVVATGQLNMNGPINGQAEVLLGNKLKTYPQTLFASMLNGSFGFHITSSAALAVSSWLGDINADGVNDFSLAGTTNISQTMFYIVFGKKAGQAFPATLHLDAIMDGIQGFSILCSNNDCPLTGPSPCQGLGDVNGDGIDDFGVGTPGQNSYAGAFYVIYGRKSYAASFDLSSLNGTTGFAFMGNTPNLYVGFSSAHVDINNDGYSDVVIGAPTLNAQESKALQTPHKRSPSLLAAVLH